MLRKSKLIAAGCCACAVLVGSGALPRGAGAVPLAYDLIADIGGVEFVIPFQVDSATGLPLAPAQWCTRCGAEAVLGLDNTFTAPSPLDMLRRRWVASPSIATQP